MRIVEGTETSFSLVANSGRVVASFAGDLEERAKQEARSRQLTLMRVTTLNQKVKL